MNVSQMVQLGKMLDIYGSMLTEKQFKILNSYINFNGSLSEIADELNISRQAVADLVKRALDRLKFFESKLHFCEKINKLKSEYSMLIDKSLLTEKQKQQIEVIYQKLIKILEE